MKMGDDTGTTSAVSLVALTRGMAIIPQSGEFVVDVIIPILLHKHQETCGFLILAYFVFLRRKRRYKIEKLTK